MIGKMSKIIFFGTPDFARKSLEKLYDEGEEILAVVTTPDKQNGRGMKVRYSPVKEFALEKNLEIYQPEKLKDNKEIIEKFKSLKPDFICVVAYGKILPKEILDIPKYGSINVHGSLLPKYRGSAPIQWSVLNGDKTTGITTIFMDEGLDTGDMILKRKIQIGEYETTGEVWDKLSILGAEVLIDTINKINNIKDKEDKTIEEIKKDVKAEKQGDKFSVAPMLNKEMAKIDWNKKTSEINNLVRGLNPIIGAYSMLDNKKIKIWKVRITSDEELQNKFPEVKEYENKIKTIENGTILFADTKKGIFIKTSDGILEILELQGENAKKMEAKNYLNGNNNLHAGKIFE